MSDCELQRFTELIHSVCGISLTPAKRSMISARVMKRIHALGIDSFSDYYKYISSPIGKVQELQSLINVVTTNTTQFFREGKHFEFLTEEGLPALLASKRFETQGCLNIWSAGFSTGEEAYTLAIVLTEFFHGDTEHFRIFATDISTKVLEHAKRAIYTSEAVEIVPPTMKRRYLMRGTGSQEGQYRVVPELRQRVEFSQLNFLDCFQLDTPMDIIMCRNVMIYFDNQLKSEFVRRFYSNLAVNGYLLIGHSETLNGINDQFVNLRPTIYTKLR
jgi:chemotaxis protein methyltransferase CheR